jgi:hypothetical protein
VIWLTFAFSLGIAGLAVTALTIHEVANWRTLHRLPGLRWLNEGGPEMLRS